MDIKEISNFIIDKYSSFEKKYLDDAIIESLKSLYNMDEFSCIEYTEFLKKKVEDKLLYYYIFSINKGIPPKIKLVNDVISGKLRPINMQSIINVLSIIDPFDFQRICCIYLINQKGYSIKQVNKYNGGIDIYALKDNLKIIIQARRHKIKSITKTEIEKWIRQVKDNYIGAAKVFMTGNTYTRDAIIYAESNHITIIDGEQIAFHLSQNKKIIDETSLIAWFNSQCIKCKYNNCDLKL